jgi:hypothetical protein
MSAYDVFLSYRRDGGAAEARLLQSQLRVREIRVFLDVTELGRGYFDDALLRHIEETPNFVVILSPNALNRAESDEDWLRKEIAHALETGRNVVPLLMPGFQFPTKLPNDIKNLPRHQGIDYSHLYFDAMMQKLVATLDLTGSPAAQQKKERASQEMEARRKSSELRQGEAAGHHQREPAASGPVTMAQLADRLGLGSLGAGAAPRQSVLTAFWAILPLAFAFLATSTSGSDRQIAFTFGALFLALAFWLRTSAKQAVTPGLAMCGLAGIGMMGVLVSHNFDANRLVIVALAAAATGAIWVTLREMRGTTPAARDPAATKSATVSPFGRRFAGLVGVADSRVQWPRVGLYAGARLASGLALSWILAINRSFFSSYHVNLASVVWVAAALPLALVATFRWLRNPLLALPAAAVLASLANPLFWQGAAAALVVVQEVAGLFVLAWAIEEIENVNVAIWCGAVTAGLTTLALQGLWGVRGSGWLPSGPNVSRVFFLALVLTAVFAGGLTFLKRRGIATGP